MNQPVSHEKRFRDRRAEMRAIGYYIVDDEFGNQFFISDSGNQIDAEDVLVADWLNWRALFKKAETQS